MLLLIALVVESPPFYHKQPLGTHTLITYMPVFWTRSVYCIMFEPAHPSVLVCNPTRYILKNEMTWTQSHGCNRLWMVLVLPMKLKKPKVQKNFPYSTQTNLMTPLPETMARPAFSSAHPVAIFASLTVATAQGWVEKHARIALALHVVLAGWRWTSPAIFFTWNQSLLTECLFGDLTDFQFDLDCSMSALTSNNCLLRPCFRKIAKLP